MARCWERLTPLLEQVGHTVVAPELPNEDGSADFDAYADFVCTALRGCDDDVLVAHSLAGATRALVPDRRPVSYPIIRGACEPCRAVCAPNSTGGW
jgi:hypothetical protein